MPVKNPPVDPKPHLLRVAKLKSMYGFEIATIWHHVDKPISTYEIKEAIQNKDFEPIPAKYAFTQERLHGHSAREYHIRRIAYISVNWVEDPISITLKPPDWPIEDGNHRLAAAIIRKEDFIQAWVFDFYRDQKKWFLKKYGI